MAPSWPTWRHDGADMVNLEAKRANLAHFWNHLGDFLLDLGRDLAKNCENQKNDDSTAFWEVFWSPGAGLGGYVGLSWRYVGLSWRYVGPSWRYVGPSWR